MELLNETQFIDIHYHADPDLYERRLDYNKAGEEYKALQGAVVLTSHLGSTAVQSTQAQQKGLPVYASLVLNAFAGGIDFNVILRDLKDYQPVNPSKLLVHFPTLTGRKFQSKLTRKLSINHPHATQGETLFNAQQKLRPEVIDILKCAKDYPMVLSTGHASREEVYSLIDACIQFDVPQLFLSQPAHPLMDFKADELIDLTKNNCVWVEQTALTYILGHQSQEDFRAVIETVPRVIYSSDLGQIDQLNVFEWLRFSSSFFEQIGLSPLRRTELTKLNALRLLGLSS